MTRLMQLTVGLAVALMSAAASTATAQTTIPGGPVRYGHHHLNVTDIEAHKTFWIGALGGEPVVFNDSQNVRLPGVLVRLRRQPPTGGTKGSSINHIGFQVPNLQATIDKLKAAGYPIVTAAEVTTVKVDGDIAFIPNQNIYTAFVMGPDETKVELIENKALKIPIALHHVHFAGKDVLALADWYAKAFGGVRGKAGNFETSDIPSVSLRWGAPTADAQAPTKGRVLDHIGFEIDNLAEFCKKLEAMGVKLDLPYKPSAVPNLSNAFLTDPSGTYIELTEGLDQYWKK